MKKQSFTNLKKLMIAFSMLNLLFAVIVFRGFQITPLHFLDGIFQKLMSTNGEATGPMDGVKLIVVETILLTHIYTLGRYRVVYMGTLKILLVVDFLVSLILMVALFLAYAASGMMEGGMQL